MLHKEKVEGLEIVWFHFYYKVFELEPLTPLFFSIATIIGIFFHTNLNIKQDFNIFLTNSLVHLTASINCDEVGKTCSLGIFDNSRSFRGGRRQLGRFQQLDHRNLELSHGENSHVALVC